MKLISMLVLGCLVASLAGYQVMAQEHKDGMMGQEMMQDKEMVKDMDKDMGKKMGKDMKMGRDKSMHKGEGKMMGKCPMHEKMMKMMMERELIATSDGGVVLMMGNKLLKYDKNLNLKKEIELKMDMESMREMKEQMKENCPMNKKMMDQNIEEK
ncbi:MAG: hypothetical protein ABII27_06695 [bacterium]